MNDDISKITEIIATDIIGLAQLAMEGDVGVNTKIDRNTLKDSYLYNSIKTQIINSNNIVVETLFQPYINYIEWDRPPKYGDPPPIDDIIEWAKAKGISTDNDVVYAIRYSIWEIGHSGRPVIEMFNKLLEHTFNEYWADDIFNAIISELIKFFN